MKTQMRFQKIIALLSLIMAALVFVYALFFLTGSTGNVWKYVYGNDLINGQKFFDASQSFVGTLTTLGIVFIILAVVLFITGCNKRRNYYLSNYIAVGLYLVFAIVVLVYMIIGISNCMNLFLNEICWESGTGTAGIYNVEDQFSEQYPVYKDVYTFIIGYVVCLLVLLCAAALALSTVLKYKLMKGEKQLLQGGAAAELVKEEAVL